MKPVPLRALYDQLFSHYGPQNWWPADTPFEVMLGAVLTQNTAWTNVEKALANLRDDPGLDAAALLALAQDDLAARVRPAGYFNVKAKRLRAYCDWYLQQGGLAAMQQRSTDALRHDLLCVHGVGPETADDILLYALQRAVFVIDAYTRRLWQRFGLISGDESYEQLRHFAETTLGEDVQLYNEYHALIVVHAKDICRPKPKCGECVLREMCPSRGSDPTG